MADPIIRTRIAPSPTGEFHIGGLRTLLFNYAWAKKNGGQFVIRIEDTDRTRFVPGATNRMLEVIKDYGFDWDEGPLKEGAYGPYIQSERLNIYREYIDRLVSQKNAYYCFCTSERLEELRNRAQADGKNFKYDRHCFSLSSDEVSSRLEQGEKYTIRMKVPDDEIVSFNDVVLGEVSIPTKEIDDQVLFKSDGYPTYHFAVVVDDSLMKISHVLRGVEWIPSTPKHILLYRFLGIEPPKFGHLPNLKTLGTNKKMSKRDGSVFAIDFLKDGYLPEAIINFLMFLGWNPGTEREFFSLEEFIKEFDINKIHKTDLVSFNRDKLDWYNNQYLIKLSNEEYLSKLIYWSQKFNSPCLISDISNKYSSENVLKIISLIKERINVFSEFDKNVDYFLNHPNLDNLVLGKYSNDPKKVLKFFYETLKNTEDFSFEYLDPLLHSLVKENSFSMKEYFMTLRISLTGETVTPPIVDIIVILGKEVVLTRLDSAISKL
jgi:nondiscriminating glutamyl-tRNA synthetase